VSDAGATLALVASSDDFLLERGLGRAVASATEAFGGVEPEVLAEEVTPEMVAVELSSPSLFAPARVLVLRDVRPWLGGAAPPGAPAREANDDLEPLLAALGDGLGDGVALVMGAWCQRRPGGPLVEAVARLGSFTWIPLPEPPKPWEEVLLSAEQRRLLGALLREAAPGVDFAPAAEDLLLERLGFAPRLLVSEAVKLAAAGAGAVVDEELVRRLTFPRERSLEVVRDAVLARDLHTLLDLLRAAEAGVGVRDWQGRRLESAGLAAVLFSQVSNLLQQMLALRRIAAAAGITRELDPGRTGARGWYKGCFTPRIAPVVLEEVAKDEGSPLVRRGKPPTAWTLSRLFAGAARWQDDELVEALADGGDVEAGLRGALPLAVLSCWLVRHVVRRSVRG